MRAFPFQETVWCETPDPDPADPRPPGGTALSVTGRAYPSTPAACSGSPTAS